MAQRYRTEATQHQGVFKLIRVSDDQWVSTQVKYRDNRGRQATETFKGRDTLDVARRFRDKVRTDRNEGKLDLGKGKATVRDFFQRFMETRVIGRLKPKTVDQYQRWGRYIVDGRLGRMQLRDVTPRNVQDYLRDLEDEGRGYVTVKGVKGLLHRMFEVAMLDEALDRNPVVQAIELKRVVPVDTGARDFHSSPVTQTELRAIADEVPGCYRALVYTLGITGLRIGEAMALRVRHLDLNKPVVHVRENATEVNGKIMTGTPKTEGSRRDVYAIPPQLATILREHLATYGAPLDPDSYFFRDKRGGQLRGSSFRKLVFHPACKAIGLDPSPRLHDLRHTAVSIMASNGYTLEQVGAEVGHKSTYMTQVYLGFFPEDRLERGRTYGSGGTGMLFG
jgi:integrase